ncbi:MAG: gfo/Idh/MocA family oxidoreductase [Verrucomicrobia bacterium]|nr:MAG: gfo/Idh/MocA family oxidoreductase [Verrucomicrobiota bacterium]
MKKSDSNIFLDRRQFLKRTALGAAGLGAINLFSVRSWSQVIGANDTVRLAVVGLRGKGKSHVRNFREIPGVKVAAICDVDADILAKARAGFEEQGESVKTFLNYQTLLEQKDIDAVVIATPNHWHTLMAIWALEAGKHVYVEKPISHNVWEGRQLVHAAANSPLVVQHGSQKRSVQALADAVAYIRAGNLGRIKVSRGLCYKRRRSIGWVDKPQPLPPSVDYNLWTGPARLEPLMRERLHYDWHWVWNTGNGDLGNQGIHEVDIARWFLGDPAMPKRVLSVGGRFGYVDNGETPNTQAIMFDYEEAPLLFEVRGLPISSEIDGMDNYKGIRVGVVVECEDGYFAGGGGGGWVYTNDGERIQAFDGDKGALHARNFIDAIRAGDPSMANGKVERGHISSALCHLGNISQRLGSEKGIDGIADRIRSNADMADAFGRMMEHCANNHVDYAVTPAALGAGLVLDRANERFTGDLSDEANKLISREYRPGFVVPDLS